MDREGLTEETIADFCSASKSLYGCLEEETHPVTPGSDQSFNLQSVKCSDDRTREDSPSRDVSLPNGPNDCERF